MVSAAAVEIVDKERRRRWNTDGNSGYCCRCGSDCLALDQTLLSIPRIKSNPFLPCVRDLIQYHEIPSYQDLWQEIRYPSKQTTSVYIWEHNQHSSAKIHQVSWNCLQNVPAQPQVLFPDSIKDDTPRRWQVAPYGWRDPYDIKGRIITQSGFYMNKSRCCRFCITERPKIVKGSWELRLLNTW